MTPDQSRNSDLPATPYGPVPFLIAVVLGAALWFGISMLTGKREPWDAQAYWALAYPAAILAAALLGYFYPERPWRWAALLFASQFLAMCVRNGELGNLWPLGIAVFAVLALPAVIAARLAARFNRRPARGDV
jgi:hypothetical protein